MAEMWMRQCVDARNIPPINQKEHPVRIGDRRFFPTCACGRICPVGKRKCVSCLKTPRKVVKGRDSRKGANARGIAAHKPDRSRTRKAKRQNPPDGMGPRDVKAYRINPAKVDRKPNEEVW